MPEREDRLGRALEEAALAILACFEWPPEDEQREAEVTRLYCTTLQRMGIPAMSARVEGGYIIANVAIPKGHG